MPAIAIFDPERPIGTSRHVWIDMGCLYGKVNVSYRVEGREAVEIANQEAASFLGHAAKDMLEGIAAHYLGLGEEIPDVTEGIVEMDGLDERVTLILRFEAIALETVARPMGRLN